jgi:ligand-binding sensor domain-containing protein
VLLILGSAKVISAQSLENWTNYTTNIEFSDFVEAEHYYWVATEGGLVRLDKNNYSKSHYNRGNSPLLSNRINSLDYDSLSNTLALAMRTGVQFLDLNTETWKTFDNSSSPFPLKNITLFRYGYDDSWWLSMENGLAHYYPETGSWKLFGTQNSELAELTVNEILIDEQNNTWVTELAIHKIDSTGKWTSLYHEDFGDSFNKIRKLTIDSSGTLWGVAAYRVVSFGGDFENLVTYNYENSTMEDGVFYNTICVDNKNRIVVGGRKFSGGDGHFPVFHNDTWSTLSAGTIDAAQTNHMGTLFSDKEGTIWVGYSRNGLFNNRNEEWRKIPTNQIDLKLSSIVQIESDNIDRVWINHGNKDLTMFDGNKWYHFDEFEDEYDGIDFTLIAHPYKNRMYMTGKFTGYWDANLDFHLINDEKKISSHSDFTFDSTGTLWGIYGNELIFIPPDSTEWQTFTPVPDIKWSYYNQLTVGKNGDIWLSEADGALFHWQSVDSSWTPYFRNNDNDDMIPGINIPEMKLLPNNELWITATKGMPGHGFSGDGIMVIDSALNVTRYKGENSLLPADDVFDLELDGNGDIWVASSNGISKFDGNKWIVFNTDNARLAENNTKAITITSSGDIWVASDSYLSQFHNGVALNTEIFSESDFSSTSETPGHIHLKPNYPNPFNPSTTLRFDLDQTADVRIEVFSLLGERIAVLANQKYAPGSHEVTFNAEGLSSGIYFFRVSTPETVQTIKGILMK